VTENELLQPSVSALTSLVGGYEQPEPFVPKVIFEKSWIVAGRKSMRQCHPCVYCDDRIKERLRELLSVTFSCSVIALLVIKYLQDSQVVL